MEDSRRVSSVLNADKVTLTEEKGVKARIWTSEYFQSHPGEDVGHISIEIPSIKVKNPKYDPSYHPTSKQTIPFYASIWPKRALPPSIQNSPSTSQGPGIFRPEEGQYLTTVEEDMLAEGRLPELMFCLYSLDPEAIVKKFKEITEEMHRKYQEIKEISSTTDNPNDEPSLQDLTAGWVLIGPNTLLNKNSGNSCATLAWSLLKAGGIDHLIGSRYSCYSSSISPDMTASALTDAKMREYQDYPEVRNFIRHCDHYQGKTRYETNVETNTPQKCLIV